MGMTDWKGRHRSTRLAPPMEAAMSTLNHKMGDELRHPCDGFLRLGGAGCGQEKLVAFSCKRRGICPSCGARRMTQTAAWLVDRVIPRYRCANGCCRSRSRCAEGLRLQQCAGQTCARRKTTPRPERG